MKLILSLQDGKQVAGEFEYVAADFAAQANTPGVTVVTLGGMVINKNMVKHISSAEPLTQEANTEIQFTDGTGIKDYVEGYDPIEIAKQFNDPRITLVAIGDTVVSKNSFKMVLQLPTTETTTA